MRRFLFFMNPLKAVERTENEIVVENYILLFDRRDITGKTVKGFTTGSPNPDGSTGNYFTKATNVTSAYTQLGTFPVDWEHGMQERNGEPGRGALGYVDWKSATQDDKGWFVRRVLDRRNAFVRALDEAGLFEAGMVGTSSEADHMRAAMRDNGEIVEWPLVKDTLTMIPMEPSMLGDNQLQLIKAAAEKFPALKAAFAANEDTVMSDKKDETKQPAAPALTLDAIKSAFADELKPLREELDAQKAAIAAWNDPTPANQLPAGGAADPKKAAGRQAPAYHKGARGDNEANAFAAYYKSGDTGGLSHLMDGAKAGDEDNSLPRRVANSPVITIKASNPQTMNITAPATAGNNVVPVGHYNGIIARRDEMMLAAALGVRNIPGVGTTVNVPIDNEDDGEFVETAESAVEDYDSPEIGQVAMTLKAYTKAIDFTYELLDDEASSLMPFINDWVGRGLAKTHNGLLVAEVAANGTAFKTFASATAIARGELEDIEGDDNLGAYLDAGSCAWVMRNSTLSKLRQISADAPWYANQEQGRRSLRTNRTLLEYPVYRSNKIDAIGAALKPVLFGNWFYVATRNGSQMRVLRDPYSRAANGEVRMHYFFRTCYKVLQAEAIGYGQHA